MYRLALCGLEDFKNMFVDAVYECGNCQVEHALLHVLQLILVVGYGVHIADVIGSLCSNIHCVCWYLQVQVVEV